MEIEKIKQAIADQGLKQGFLAEKMGVSKSVLSLWLNGYYKMPVKRIEQIKGLLSIK